MSILQHIPSRDREAYEAVRRHARPLAPGAGDDAELMALLAGSRFALLGEASHGTDEFYRERAGITNRLIVEHGFAAVAVEADWPDALRIDRYVRGESGDASAREALADFKRFPTWMWRNRVVAEFVEWLREHNAALPPERRCGFYGIDLYSLFTSMDAVLAYLDRADPQAGRRARERYACFDHFHQDSQAYAYAARFGLTPTCEQEVVSQLQELLAVRGRDAGIDPAARFHAEQNARLVRNAEAYYRTMFSGRVSSWNLRDRHMLEMLEALHQHLGAGRAEPPRLAVWAHNSHLGDARATEMAERGEWNLGQLVRERHGDAAALLGFSTHHGTVTAANDWDAEHEKKRVSPGLDGSYELLFHQVAIARFALVLRGNDELAQVLAAPRLQRAIGVIYRPETERQSHYFRTHLPRQFDAVVHIDQTHALEPLDRTEPHTEGEAPETYPSGV
ncbi:MAG: erythromycin esterase family protein [Caldimonas sp.]